MQGIIDWLQKMAQVMSVEAFVVLGSFVEELIAPIPAPFIMTTAAVIAKEQNYPLVEFALIVFLGSLVKTIMAVLVFVIMDKAEDAILRKFGRFLGITHVEIEKAGHMLRGKWWDDLLLFTLRAVPVFPTLLVTMACGFIKYPVKPFITMTFLGLVARNILYVLVGYFGFGQGDLIYEAVRGNLTLSIVVVVVVGILGFLVYWFKERILAKFTGEKEV